MIVISMCGAVHVRYRTLNVRRWTIWLLFSSEQRLFENEHQAVAVRCSFVDNQCFATLALAVN